MGRFSRRSHHRCRAVRIVHDPGQSGVKNAYQQHVRGVVSDEEWAVSKAFALMQLSWPFGRAYWLTNRPFFDPGFVAAIEGDLDSNPDIASYIESFDADLKLVLASMQKQP